MSFFKKYVLWRYPHIANENNYAQTPIKTNKIFLARNMNEAQKKLDKFWKKGKFGAGSVFLEEIKNV